MPPELCERGVGPSHAAKERPEENSVASPRKHSLNLVHRAGHFLPVNRAVSNARLRDTNHRGTYQSSNLSSCSVPPLKSVKTMEEEAMGSYLFRNVTVWDGINDEAYVGEVLVEGIGPLSHGAP